MPRLQVGWVLVPRSPTPCARDGCLPGMRPGATAAGPARPKTGPTFIVECTRVMQPSVIAARWRFARHSAVIASIGASAPGMADRVQVAAETRRIAGSSCCRAPSVALMRCTAPCRRPGRRVYAGRKPPGHGPARPQSRSVISDGLTEAFWHLRGARRARPHSSIPRMPTAAAMPCRWRHGPGQDQRCACLPILPFRRTCTRSRRGAFGAMELTMRASRWRPTQDIGADRTAWCAPCSTRPALAI